MSATMTKTTLEAWQAEMRERFPEGMDTAAFVCACCGNVASLADFKAVGADPQRAPQECIGRAVNAADAPKMSNGDPCDWAAFGLFRTLGNGRIIDMGDKEIEVFKFAGEGDA